MILFKIMSTDRMRMKHWEIREKHETEVESIVKLKSALDIRKGIGILQNVPLEIIVKFSRNHSSGFSTLQDYDR